MANLGLMLNAIAVYSGRPSMEERLHKILSQWGIASRRQAEIMILAGRVQINGRVVTQLGQKANPTLDCIEVDGRAIAPSNRPQQVYLLLNKPFGVVSTCHDPRGRTTVLDLLPPNLRSHQGIHPVGRLDGASTGALLLTNDGDLTFHLTHPRHSVAKTYRVWVRGTPTQSILETWRAGVMLSGRRTSPAQVRVLSGEREGDRTLLEVIICEGRNRQIRRVAEQLGYPVVRLHRTAIGSICLQQLNLGAYRHLHKVEIESLKSRSKAAVVKERNI